tara:strand:+ start:16 stop:1137 length:1122 start_codon:yes stop_codon:yes gene_type:complete
MEMEKDGRFDDLVKMGSMAATGGYAQAALGTAQTIYGLSQLPRARREFERARAAAPSLETPSQFYENYKNAYDATLAGMERDAIQANLATSVQALQGAGGRALVGGLSQATAQSQLAQNRMLAQERQMRFQAGQALAGAEERSIARKETRNQRDQAYANQAYQAALGNIGGGLSAVGTGLMYAMSEDEDKDKENESKSKSEQLSPETQGISPKQLELQQKDRENFAAETRKMIQQAKTPSFLKTPQVNMPSLTETFLSSAFPKTSAPANISQIPFEFMNEQAMNQLNVLRQGVMPVLDIFNQTNPFKHGGMMTNGDFSHDRNPIDIVQDGAKVGEMTGGEYIINPNQAKKIASQSTYARKLFKRFERNAKKNK